MFDMEYHVTDDAAAVALWSGGTICLFGVAWLFSTFTKSAPISASVSIAATIVIAVLTGSGRYQGEPFLILALVMAVIGLSSLVAGTIYYLRRISP